MAVRQPIKLEEDPIQEAIFELRFQTEIAALADLLPGMIFPRVRDRFPQSERLPSSFIPRELQQTQPELRYQPRHKISGDASSIGLGDFSVMLNTQRPYVGWEAFRPVILELVGLVREFKVVSKLERFSLKYSNLLQAADAKERYELTDFAGHLGKVDLARSLTQVRTEFDESGFRHIVELIGSAVVKNAKGESREGVYLAIDTICLDADGFFENPQKQLDAAHATEKAIFYSVLTDFAVQLFKPVWAH